MTRQEIMENRILSKEVVDLISSDYWETASCDYFDSHDYHDEEELAQSRYISDEKIQRMSPEDVLDIIVQYVPFLVHNTNDIIRALSAATGRTEDDLRIAIFGEGDFDARKFYQPTEAEKVVIKAACSIRAKLANAGVEPKDFAHWPQDCRDEWYKALEGIPDEAMPSEMKEVNEYLLYYSKHGIPEWLY